MDEVARAGDEGGDFGAESLGALPAGVLLLKGGGVEVEGAFFIEAESETGPAGDDDEDGEKAFEEHAAVGDGLGVLFVGALFGGGAGGDEAMEAGDGSAGEGDEEEGEEGGGTGGLGLVEGGDHGGVGGENAGDE